MHFCHSMEIWNKYPELVAGVLTADGITPGASVESQIQRFNLIASERLQTKSEGELPEIQAWRRAFSKMGLKPTQYRCASESLLRRFRKDGPLPHLHPVIDLCNAISLAFAVPIAVFDVSKIAGYIEVRPANGSETYLTFSNEVENPDPGEVIFADGQGKAHARRWTNRQSLYSAVQEDTFGMLIVAEAMHATAHADVRDLIRTISEELASAWPVTPKSRILDKFSPQFEF